MAVGGAEAAEAAEAADALTTTSSLLHTSDWEDDEATHATGAARVRRLRVQLLAALLLLLLLVALLLLILATTSLPFLWRGSPGLITIGMDAADSSVQSLFAYYATVCGSEGGHNHVLAREESGLPLDVGELPWTLTPDTFSSFGLPQCRSLEELLRAVNLGQRHPLDPAVPRSAMDSLGPTVPSYFRPEGCSLQWLSVDEACGLLSSFSTVLLLGNSHSRHMMQALFAFLTADLRWGGLPRFSGNPNMLDRCQCDGQFSEHRLCREVNKESMYHMVDSRDYGVCSRHSRLGFLAFTGSVGVTLSEACRPDDRPSVLVLQGGSHEGNWQLTSAANDLHLQELNEWLERCPFPQRWSVLWIGAPAQRRQLDALYPTQQRERTAESNERTAEHMQRVYRAPMLSFWNLSADAASSDGFHWLTDVNVWKAMSMLNALQLLTHEAPNIAPKPICAEGLLHLVPELSHSFEFPDVPLNMAVYSPKHTAWTWTHGGIARAGGNGAMDPPAPATPVDGRQFAFLQLGLADVAYWLNATVKNLTVGASYAVSFAFAVRAGGGGPRTSTTMSVLLDEQLVHRSAAHVSDTEGGWSHVRSQAVRVSSQSVQLAFLAVDEVAEDRSLLFDAVLVQQVAES